MECECLSLILNLPLNDCVTWSKCLNFSVPVSSSVNGNKNSTHLIGLLQRLKELTCKGLQKAPGTTIKSDKYQFLLGLMSFSLPLLHCKWCSFLFLFSDSLKVLCDVMLQFCLYPCPQLHLSPK